MPAIFARRRKSKRSRSSVRGPHPFVLAALVGAFVGIASLGLPQSTAVSSDSWTFVESVMTSASTTVDPPMMPVENCTAVDGDTLRCGSERIRLIGIDTPEMPGHCREGRQCVAGDPFAAQAALARTVGSSMTIRRFGTDSYGRTLALVGGPTGDLSCAQLRGGYAIYRADWDMDGAMKRSCG